MSNSIGTIQKVVKVAVGADLTADLTAGLTDGYGIIRGTDGREVFFVSSAVAGGRFVDLQQGQQVFFALEEGPLGRAAMVKLPRSQAVS